MSIGFSSTEECPSRYLLEFHVPFLSFFLSFLHDFIGPTFEPMNNCCKILHFDFEQPDPFDSYSCYNFAKGDPFNGASVVNRTLCLDGNDQYLAVSVISWLFCSPFGIAVANLCVEKVLQPR